MKLLTGREIQGSGADYDSEPYTLYLTCADVPLSKTFSTWKDVDAANGLICTVVAICELYFNRPNRCDFRADDGALNKL